MANIKFYLKGVKEADFETPEVANTTQGKIYFRYLLGRYIDFSKSLNLSILIDNWDNGKQRPKNRSSILNKATIEERISKIKETFERYELSNQAKGYIPSKAEVNKLFIETLKPKQPEQVKEEWTLHTFIEDFITRARTEKNEITGKQVSTSTIKAYQIAQKWLLTYHKEVSPINFQDINLEFYYSYVEWLEGKNYSANYIGKLIKELKCFMNKALDKNITTNTAFKHKKFKVFKEAAETIALTNKELENIYNLDLSEQPILDRARDLFLIAAYTGLRVSDFTRLTKENIKTVEGVRMFKIQTTKTGKVVAIPLNSTIESILAKYGGQTPKRMPDQHINKYIKKIAQIVKMDSVEVVTKTIGGKVTKTKYKRYELVHNHTARRTFCTNAYLSGMPIQFIMQISGHTTEESFLRYVKATPEQVAKEMSKHTFFKQPQLKVV